MYWSLCVKKKKFEMTSFSWIIISPQYRDIQDCIIYEFVVADESLHDTRDLQIETSTIYSLKFFRGAYKASSWILPSKRLPLYWKSTTTLFFFSNCKEVDHHLIFFQTIRRSTTTLFFSNTKEWSEENRLLFNSEKQCLINPWTKWALDWMEIVCFRLSY